MATYIGLRTLLFEDNIRSPYDFKYVVNSGTEQSYPLTLTGETNFIIAGNAYTVYLVGSAANDYSIDATWFTHTYGDNIGSKYDLPLNSQIIVGTPYTNTYPGTGVLPSGTLYTFNGSVSDIKTSNVWSSDTNPGGIAGTPYTYYNKQTSTTSSGKCTDYGFCPTSSYGVSIVELYHSTNGVSNATGLYTSIINRGEKTLSNWSKGTYKSWIYDYYRESNTGSSYPARINGTGRKVFAIHNTTGGDCNLAIAYGGSTSAALSDTNYTIGSFGYIRVEYNTWAHHTTQGKHYYSTTVNKNNQFIGTRLQLEAGSAYTIKMHTYSEANYDGIIIATGLLNSTVSVSTGGITRCSGVDKTVTYTLPSDTSTRTLYIYFKTDSSALKGPGDVDSTGASINNSTIPNYSTGDVEIYKDKVYVVTFNANGGTGGTKTTNVIVGQSLNLNTIIKPTRTGWDFYKWSTSTNPFKFVSSPYTPKGNVTLYAIWGNFPKFTELSDKSVYCTDDCIAASSTQGSKSIKLFSGTGMTCSAGTVTYMSNISKVYPVGSPTSPISGATIQPVGIDNNVTVPAGTPAGDYIADIVVYTSLSMGSTGSYYGPHSAQPAEYKIPFTIKATTLTYGPVQYMTYTPDGELTNGDITQQKKFPAGRFTISPDSISEYFRVYGVFKQEVSCNNGTKREGNVTVHGWNVMPNFSNIIVPSLGTTETSQYTYTFANDDTEGLVFVAEGEGNKLFQKFILSGVRQANELTGITLSLGSNPINYNTTTTATVTAKYTSGSSTDVTNSLSTSSSATSNYIKSGDTSVVTIS